MGMQPTIFSQDGVYNGMPQFMVILMGEMMKHHIFGMALRITISASLFFFQAMGSFQL